MLSMEVPSFVFHAFDVKPKFYRMWSTVEGKPRESVRQLVPKIYGANAAANASLNTSLKNVILNVHGSPGLLRIGGMEYEATLKDDLAPFSILKGSGIGTIWIVSCNVAKGSEGKTFCRTLAQLTGTTLIASEIDQIVTFREAVTLVMSPLSGAIDSYEGSVIAFLPNGTMQRSRDPAQLVNTLRRPLTSEELMKMHPFQVRPPM